MSYQCLKIIDTNRIIIFHSLLKKRDNSSEPSRLVKVSNFGKVNKTPLNNGERVVVIYGDVIRVLPYAGSKPISE